MDREVVEQKLESLRRCLQGPGETIAPNRTAKNTMYPVGAHPGAKAVARLQPLIAPKPVLSLSKDAPTKGNPTIVRVFNQTVTNCHGLKMQAALLKQHGYSVNVSVE